MPTETQAQGFLFSRPMEPGMILPLREQIGGGMSGPQPGAWFSFGAGRGA